MWPAAWDNVASKLADRASEWTLPMYDVIEHCKYCFLYVPEHHWN